MDNRAFTESKFVSDDTCLSEVEKHINDAYERAAENIDMAKLKLIFRTSRKHGFPIVCVVDDEIEQLRNAAKLLISASDCYPRENIPENLKLVVRSTLFKDAKQLVDNGVGNLRHLIAITGDK